jgi:hypothetical protein
MEAATAIEHPRTFHLNVRSCTDRFAFNMGRLPMSCGQRRVRGCQVHEQVFDSILIRWKT